MRILIISLIFLLLTGVLTACGRNRSDSSTNPAIEIEASGSALTYNQGQPQTLTILTNEHLVRYPQQEVATRFSAAMSNEGVTVQVVFDTYTNDDHVERYAILPSQLAAGLGPDIIMSHPTPLYKLIQNGLLADINVLIDNCPNTQRDEFFENVLDAFEIDGKLYTFPRDFTYQLVGINANLPQAFIDRFNALETVTYLQLMEIYMDLRRQYPNWGHMHFGFNANPFRELFAEQLSHNINMATRSIDITNLFFENFLEGWRSSFAPQFLCNNVRFESSPVLSAETFTLYSEKYVFFLTGWWLEKANALFDFESHYFVNFIPLVDENGRLVMNQFWPAASVGHSANGQLAWSFISEYANPQVNPWGGLNRNIISPIRKNLFEGELRLALRQALSPPALTHTASARFCYTAPVHTFSPQQLFDLAEEQIIPPGQRTVRMTWPYTPNIPHTLLPIVGLGDFIREEQIIEAAIAQLYSYANMPMAPLPLSHFYMPSHLYRDVLDEWLLDETIPASEIAERIERNITEWLNREITPIIPYVPAEAVHTGREDLPVRTLSVLSVEVYEPLFLEAATRMTEEWARRGYDYNFDLTLTIANVSDYMPDDIALWTTETFTAAWEQMLMRVRTQLMAGQGHDIMCLSVLANLWSHVETGLFVDIYQLIDQCPYTNRADFFTQALAPFEMDGSLYAFPTNFGFAYVGVNEILPQSFIDRFTAMQTITLPELIGMYLELQQYPEFTDIAFTNADLASSPYSAFHHVLLQYINFPNSTAHLTDSGFVSFLRDFRQLYDWANHPFDRFPHMSVYEQGQDFAPGRGAIERRVIPFYHIKNVSEQYAFWIEDVYAPALTMADSADSPFLHFIPITDYQGRLTYVTNTPTLTVTTRADGALAWEFIQHLIYVTVNPTRQAQYNDEWHAPWGRYTLNTPISRVYFETHFTENLARIFDDAHLGEAPYAPGQVRRALARVVGYNEMPMTYRNMPIPRSLYFDILEQFIRGLITPEDAAQQLHNRVSLWLIE